MRKNLYLLLLIVLTLIVGGCRKSDFKVNFALDAEVWGNYQLSYYASDGVGGKWISTTVPLQNGKFSLTGFSRNPVLIYLARQGEQEIEIYVKPGQSVEITGSSNNPYAWNVTGNETNKLMSQWRNEVSEKSKAEREGSLIKFVEANPDQPASALLLLSEFPRKQRPEEFVKLWNNLGAKAEPAIMASISGSPDFEGAGPFELNSDGKIRFDAPRRIVKSLALRRQGGRGDTLRFAPGNPALLYFYRRGNNAQSEIADTLKRLRKSFPDSVKAPIATISLDPDSINWQAALTFDSIPRVLAAWMPLGISDERALMLGIGHTPYYLVIDKDGKQRYRGDSHIEAVRIYREVLAKSDKN